MTVGVGSADSRRDHLGQILRVQHGRPMVTLKLAQTKDGYCAPAGGGRLQISGDDAMREVHMLRVHHDAIMVGVGTVLADDPQLNVRLPGLEHCSPVRVVLDSDLRTPLTSRLVATAGVLPLWVITAEDASAEAERALREKGAEVMRVARSTAGRLELHAALQLLALRGITQSLLRGRAACGRGPCRGWLWPMSSSSRRRIMRSARSELSLCGRDLVLHLLTRHATVFCRAYGTVRMSSRGMKGLPDVHGTCE